MQILYPMSRVNSERIAALVAAGNVPCLSTDNRAAIVNIPDHLTSSEAQLLIDSVRDFVDDVAGSGSDHGIAIILRHILTLIDGTITDKYAHIKSSAANEEAIDANAETHLHANRHASTNESQSSDQAVSNEEIEDGTTQQGTAGSFHE